MYHYLIYLGSSILFFFKNDSNLFWILDLGLDKLWNLTLRTKEKRTFQRHLDKSVDANHIQQKASLLYRFPRKSLLKPHPDEWSTLINLIPRFWQLLAAYPTLKLFVCHWQNQHCSSIKLQLIYLISPRSPLVFTSPSPIIEQQRPHFNGCSEMSKPWVLLFL